MTDLSIADFATIDLRAAGRKQSLSATTIVLTVFLIIGLPAVFWISVLELSNYAFSLGLALSDRMAIAGVLIGLLGFIWGVLFATARRRQAEFDQGDELD